MTTSAHGNNTSFNLCVHSPLEIKDELDEKLEKCYLTVKGFLENLSSEREINDILTKHVSIGNPQHEEVCVGLLSASLLEPDSSSKYFQALMMVNRDSMTCAVTHLNAIIIEKYRKLADVSRQQLIWIIQELVKTNAGGCENLCIALLKHIIGGDLSTKNIWLCEAMLDLLANHRGWLDKYLSLLKISVYTYLRLLQDHFPQNFALLRKKEVDFVVSLMRDKWLECCGIGRDLIRLLSAVARIPEIEKIWGDIIDRPQTLSPSFTGILSLLQTRTSRKFLSCRLTYDMEAKIAFLLMKVRFSQHKRYEEWFHRQYLGTPESQTLRSDLTRFICGCIHPSNHVICSDILPRWAVIGWLLSTSTSRTASAYCNLALYWDWLFFSPEVTSIMDIEPAILLMFQSAKNHPAITTSLLDFLCRTMVEFHPPIAPQIKQGVHRAFKTILEKRVVHSLSPILEHPRIDPELRALVRSNLREFTQQEGKPPNPPLPSDPTQLEGNPPLPQQEYGDSDVIIGEEPMTIEDDDSDSDSNTKKESVSASAIFSDDDDNEAVNVKKVTISSPEHPDIELEMAKLEEPLREMVAQLRATEESDEKCERVQDIVDHVLSMEEFDSEVSEPLSACLTVLLSDHFSKNVIRMNSCDITNEYLEGCIEKPTPLYVIFRNLCQERRTPDSFAVLLQLLAEMHAVQRRIGSHLLFFLAVKNQSNGDDNLKVYESFAQSTQLGDVYNCLMMDAKQCQDDDVTMLVYLVPHIFTQFPEHSVGNNELLNIIVSVLDPQQLGELICKVMTGLVMMKKSNVLDTLRLSLDWESFDQYCVWDLFLAHDIPLEVVFPLLKSLNIKLHAEAISKLLPALKQTRPTQDLIEHVISRNHGDDDVFATALLRHWSIEHTRDVSEHLTALLCKTKPRNTPPRKGLRQRYDVIDDEVKSVVNLNRDSRLCLLPRCFVTSTIPHCCWKFKFV